MLGGDPSKYTNKKGICLWGFKLLKAQRKEREKISFHTPISKSRKNQA
jgi:hypothetical protein